MILLYCVVDDVASAAAACAAAGVEGMLVVDAGRFGCVGRVGGPGEFAEPPAGEAESGADLDALVQHDAVIRRLMQDCTVVPFRYGALVEAEYEVREQMAARTEEFETLLARLQGKVELALRAASSPPPRRCDGSGRGYLRTLRHHAGRSVLHELHRTLSAASDAAVVVSDRGCSLKSSYLVDEGGVDGFCRLLAGTLSGMEGVQGASLTGPWAPYSFSTLGELDAPGPGTMRLLDREPAAPVGRGPVGRGPVGRGPGGRDG